MSDRVGPGKELAVKKCFAVARNADQTLLMDDEV